VNNIVSFAHSGNPLFVNNILQFLSVGDSNPVLSNNLFEDSFPKKFTDFGNNIIGDPKFENKEKGNFNLLVNSPCIDKGTNDKVYSQTDIYGKQRIWDGNSDGVSTVDIGAIEYGASEIINKIPIANAGTDQTVIEGTPVILDGTLSNDSDGNSLTYKWNAPVGITLSSSLVAKPSFTAPEVTQDTQFTFSLIVSDGISSSTSDQVVVTVKNVNKIPIANAGADQTVNKGAAVTLDGSASSDPDNAPGSLTYKWTSPAGIILSSSFSVKPTFIAPEVNGSTNFVFSLNVFDGIGESQPDQVVITVKNINKAPVANAGTDQTVNEGATVTMDGTSSSDPDGTKLTYKWTAPAGITLSSTIGAKPTFTAPEVRKDSVLIFTLVVNDGLINSEPSTVKISVKNVIKTGVEILEMNGLKIYPNPSAGIFKIEGLTSNQKSKISIYAIDGKLIRKRITYSTTETIDLSDQISGTYLLNVNNHTYKILKE
jgi:hypothetical protein